MTNPLLRNQIEQLRTLAVRCRADRPIHVLVVQRTSYRGLEYNERETVELFPRDLVDICDLALNNYENH